MKILAFCVVVLFALKAKSEERIRVVVPSEVEQQVQDLLERVSAAVEKEDHKAYAACFSKKARAKYCEKAAMDFVSHDMGMELGRWIIIEENEDNATFVVKYTMTRDGHGIEYVSMVRTLREDSKFVVDKEQVQSSRPVGSGRDRAAAIQVACKDGRCPLPQQAQRQERFIPSLFNDVNGNPDPNGIMWLDPTKLFGEECAPCNRRAN